MIKITGTTHQTFSFPADVVTASGFYRDFSRILRYLPHIYPAKTYRPDQFRVMYHTVELGAYRVRIFCDLHVRYDEATQTLHTAPLLNKPPIRSEATVQSLTAQGYFTSRSVFKAHGDHTVVDYQLSLEARLPKPFGLMLMPDKVIQQIANNITAWRIHEIAGGFIKRSVQAYREQAVIRAPASLMPSEWHPTDGAPPSRRAR
jgi:hypothetical protein